MSKDPNSHRHRNMAAVWRLPYTATPTGAFLKDDFTWTAITPSAITNDITAVEETPYQATTTNTYIFVSASTSSISIVLPGSPPTGTVLVVKKLDSTANTVVISAAPSLIDDWPTASLVAQYESVTLVYDGTYWWVT